jgi:hypothetical protein
MASVFFWNPVLVALLGVLAPLLIYLWKKPKLTVQITQENGFDVIQVQNRPGSEPAFVREIGVLPPRSWPGGRMVLETHEPALRLEGGQSRRFRFREASIDQYVDVYFSTPLHEMYYPLTLLNDQRFDTLHHILDSRSRRQLPKRPLLLALVAIAVKPAPWLTPNRAGRCRLPLNLLTAYAVDDTDRRVYSRSWIARLVLLGRTKAW